MAQGSQKLENSDKKIDAPENKENERLRRENDYMDHLLQKVKDIFKIDPEAALIDLEIYLTKLMPDNEVGNQYSS